MQLKRRSHWNTFQQNDRDTMKENKKVKGEKLRVMAAISWKIWTTEWHHRNHIYMCILLLLLSYWIIISSHKHSYKAKSFALWLHFPPWISSHDETWHILVALFIKGLIATFLLIRIIEIFWIYRYIYIIVYLTDDNNHCSEKMLPLLSFSSSVAPTVRKLKLIQ